MRRRAGRRRPSLSPRWTHRRSPSARVDAERTRSGCWSGRMRIEGHPAGVGGMIRPSRGRTARVPSTHRHRQGPPSSRRSRPSWRLVQAPAGVGGYFVFWLRLPRTGSRDRAVTSPTGAHRLPGASPNFRGPRARYRTRLDGRAAGWGDCLPGPTRRCHRARLAEDMALCPPGGFEPADRIQPARRSGAGPKPQPGVRITRGLSTVSSRGASGTTKPPLAPGPD